MLSNKPSPSTPIRSRTLHDPITDSPIACPSLTGAEENTSFASPPVPALQRKLLRMSMQGRPTSGLRSEVRFEYFEADNTTLGNDSIEILTEDHLNRGIGEARSSWEDLGLASEEAIVFNRRVPNPPPAFDPDVSLGDVSLIEIYRTMSLELAHTWTIKKMEMTILSRHHRPKRWISAIMRLSAI
jgi:hypothetical protein